MTSDHWLMIICYAAMGAAVYAGALRKIVKGMGWPPFWIAAVILFVFMLAWPLVLMVHCFDHEEHAD